jgi:hypothetical protein
VPKGRSDLVSRHREPALRDVPRPRPPSRRKVILNGPRSDRGSDREDCIFVAASILGNSSQLPDALQVREHPSDCLPLKEFVFECRFEGEQKPKARLKLAGN